MYPWGNAPAATAYAVGSTVRSGECCGTVVTVDTDKATMGIVWSDGDSPIMYPMDAPYLRRGLPWE